MAYSTTADVIARSALLNAPAITDAATYIAIADADIDADLRDLYSVPFTGTIPPVVVRLSADKAAALKLRQLFRAGNESAGLFADLLKDYTDTLAALRSGAMTLDYTRQASIPGGDGVAPSWSSQTDSTGEPVAPIFGFSEPDATTTTLLENL